MTRNRLRRRLRAVVRQLRPPLAPGAYLLSAGAPAAVLSFDQLRTAVAEAIAGLPVQR